ncbi:hypothetical protein BOTBODRAFT_32384 [Botryobasidium botryosum FD-172 SS1]|uniref:Cytochrome P450 n=1 Tax=Botryobasidium botryosum (strain FD-172 SS1) TaxID=930990 RepID=A0A067MGI2_BOTB1|nr:hypothetical protein BOTBODRAFT_32384 [Botryobasidium botryosum FD-172 SS1]
MLGVLLGGLILSLLLVYRHRTKKAAENPRGLPFPPGPKPLPLLGNTLQIPITGSWHLYTKWQKTYGDIVRFKLFGQSVVILNSYEAANDLLHQRANFQDRIRYEMTGELMGWINTVPFVKYGSRWRRHRKIMHSALHSGAVGKFNPAQHRFALEYLNDLLDAPEDFIKSLRLMAAKVIMHSVYKVEVKNAENEYVTLAETAIKQINDTIPSGAFLVNFFPFLCKIPSWFPGAGFQHIAAEGKKTVEEMSNKPLEYVKRRMAEGIAEPSESFASMALENYRYDGAEDDIKCVSATLYTAGADTTVSALKTFILAMALFPEVQKKAQAEIDRVVGNGRLPTFEDREGLPYIGCVIKEVLRWRVVLPLGVGHSTHSSDYYAGYYFPRDTLVHPNVWAMTRDEKMYPDPEKFWPERFEGRDKDKDIVDPHMYAFGFGRRICPGMHFARATMYITIVSLLTAFDITKAVDEQGREITPDGSDDGCIINHVNPFKCKIKPRSPRAVELIKKGVEGLR